MPKLTNKQKEFIAGRVRVPERLNKIWLSLYLWNEWRAEEVNTVIRELGLKNFGTEDRPEYDLQEINWKRELLYKRAV